MNEPLQPANAASAAPIYKRRVVFIKRTLQTKYAVTTLFFTLAVVVILGVEFYYTILKILNEGWSLDQAHVLSRIHSLVLAKLALYSVIVLIASIFLSFLFAGPVYRFEKSADIIGSGDLTHRIYLRKWDELHDLKDRFNEMAESLQSKVQKDRHLRNRVLARLDEIAKTIDIGSPQAQKDLLALKAEIDHITSEFRI